MGAFAPFHVFPLAWLGLAVLAALLCSVVRTRDGFLIGLAWGFGCFIGGVSWLYIALTRYGGMPMPAAAFSIALFCAYLALFPALAAALQVRWRASGVWTGGALFAAAWALSECLRGSLFTGFPWLAIGYSQAPPSPLAGWMPVVGVFGTGLLLAFSAAVPAIAWRRRRLNVWVFLPLAVAVATGAALRGVVWTQAHGAEISVALVQTNVEQGLKWAPERLGEVLRLNAALVEGPPADLVVLPETTLPMLVERLPEGYLDALAARAAARGAGLVLGVFERDAQGQIFNAALGLGPDGIQRYAKHHLVPFGEYMPPLFGWFYRLADIPMSNQTRGPAQQPPMRFGDQAVALNICYEDLFGAELIRALPQASLMLNISNLAWYGDSFAQPQHLQIAQVRALESGRPMLRSTNTGMTAVVEADGTVAAVLPPFVRETLQVTVQGRAGLTPYARWGDWPVLVLAVLLLCLAGIRARRHAGVAPGGESQ